MSRRKGRGWIALGLALIAAALFLTVWNLREAAAAQAAAEDVLEDLDETIPAAETDAASDVSEREIPDYQLNPNMDMPTQTVSGRDYVGVLEIPSLGIRLPVLSEWSYPNLKVAPCRYSGSAYTGDLVVAAHNYASHFGGLKTMQMGQRVTFTDLDGNVFCYEAAELELLEPTAVEEMTAGDWDLTLFTCTVGGRSRVTLRCVQVQE